MEFDGSIASSSYLQLLECDRSLARKRHFHIVNSWNLTEASQESSVCIHHACHLNVGICTKHCVFSGKRSYGCGEKVGPCAGRFRASPAPPRTARAVELMVQRNSIAFCNSLFADYSGVAA